jgi:integrase
LSAAITMTTSPASTSHLPILPSRPQPATTRPSGTTLAGALVARSANRYRGWGDVVIFAAGTGARIGEVSGCQVGDIDTTSWTWTIPRRTTPGPGGLTDKGTKSKRPARFR